ncbi:MAG: YdcF family protein [Beijerinckiaceae bacterium]
MSVPSAIRIWGRRIVLASLALAIVGLAGGFVFFVNIIDSEEPTALPPADGVVALTGGSERVNEAVELLAKGRARRLLITGVNQQTSRREIARLMPSFQQLFDCCIDLGREALNTAGNADETRRWVEAKDIRSTLIVVTSNYHMPRALVELRSALPKLDLIPYPVVSDRFRNSDWRSDHQVARLLAVEYVKFLAALVRTKIMPPALAQPDDVLTATRLSAMSAESRR